MFSAIDPVSTSIVGHSLNLNGKTHCLPTDGPETVEHPDFKEDWVLTLATVVVVVVVVVVDEVAVLASAPVQVLGHTAALPSTCSPPVVTSVEHQAWLLSTPVTPVTSEHLL